MSSLVQISETLNHQIQQIEAKVQSMKKAKIAEKSQLANKYNKQCKRTKNLLETYKYTIQDSPQENKLENYKATYQQYKLRLQKVQKAIEYNRTEGLSKQVLFEGRNANKANEANSNERGQMIQIGHDTQQQGLDALKRINKNVIIMDQQADAINIELDKQINQLDKIYDDLKDTDTTLKRAQKHLKYFARQVYTDRLMICLIILIAIAIIVIIILSAIGKTPAIAIDGLK